MESIIMGFQQISMADLAQVGGKNASLGEMFQHVTSMGISVPDGYAVTAAAYWAFLKENGLDSRLTNVLKQLDTEGFSNLSEVGAAARKLILNGILPYEHQVQIIAAYQQLQERVGEEGSVAVRSSATAEDLPEASFAGQQESYLNIKGETALLDACLHCYASLFTDRAIKYRADNGFRHMDVALSIGVQQMVRSDRGCAGIAFTIDPESGFPNVIVIDGAWGLGENVVKGRIAPDEFVVFKPALQGNKKSIISKKLGRKEEMLIYADEYAIDTSTKNISTPLAQRERFVLKDEEVEKLARWSLIIEDHYHRPMDIEWAKDGITGELYIVQARPETVHASSHQQAFKTYQLKEKSN